MERTLLFQVQRGLLTALARTVSIDPTRPSINDISLSVDLDKRVLQCASTDTRRLSVATLPFRDESFGPQYGPSARRTQKVSGQPIALEAYVNDAYYREHEDVACTLCLAVRACAPWLALAGTRDPVSVYRVIDGDAVDFVLGIGHSAAERSKRVGEFFVPFPCSGGTFPVYQRVLDTLTQGSVAGIAINGAYLRDAHAFYRDLLGKLFTGKLNFAFGEKAASPIVVTNELCYGVMQVIMPMVEL